MHSARERPPLGVSASLPAWLIALYRDDPDAGVHSSIAYLLRRWGMNSEVRADRLRAGREAARRPRLVRQLVGDHDGDHRGSRTSTAVTTRARTTTRARFAIATTETPLALFQEFDPTHAARRREEYKTLPETDPKAPADVLSYFDAARFCNWLSQREHIPPDQWCYRPGKEEGTMVLAPDYLKLRGYRLPTVPEWEFAARAGTTTDRYFGQNLAFVADYAWYNANSGFHTQPIGRLRPNDFGLFDVLGNVSEWCRNPTPVPHPKCDILSSRKGTRSTLHAS